MISYQEIDEEEEEKEEKHINKIVLDIEYIKILYISFNLVKYSCCLLTSYSNIYLSII